MLPLNFASRPNGLKILCLGAHCDDIEIGCGGTLLRLTNEYAIQNLKWLVFTSTRERSAEAMLSAEHFVQRCKEREIIIKNFRDGHLPFEAEQIKTLIENLKSFDPD